MAGSNHTCFSSLEKPYLDGDDAVIRSEGMESAWPFLELYCCRFVLNGGLQDSSETCAWARAPCLKVVTD